MENKICPLLALSAKIPQSLCLEDNCAWFVEADSFDKAHGYKGCCSMLAIGGSVDCVADVLERGPIEVECRDAST